MVIESDYYWIVTGNELKRLLKQKGCRFEEGTRHTFVYLGSKRTSIPRHPSEEIKRGTLRGILKALGLKP